MTASQTTPLLLTVSIWWGPSRSAPVEERFRVTPTLTTEALYTELPLGEALERIQKYERTYEAVYGNLTVSEYSLIGVSVLPVALTDKERECGKLRAVETMSSSIDEELAENGPWRDRPSANEAHAASS